MSGILWAAFWFAVFGGVLGAALAIASKLLAVKTDPKIEQIRELLPGANCGGCGHSGCDAMAQAIAEGKADVSGCGACSEQAAQAICALMGVSQGTHRRMRAQVMCSGTTACAKEKYRYNGVRDCVCAAKLGGGTKECPNGCIGFGTCAAHCPFRDYGGGRCGTSQCEKVYRMRNLRCRLPETDHSADSVRYGILCRMPFGRSRRTNAYLLYSWLYRLPSV